MGTDILVPDSVNVMDEQEAQHCVSLVISHLESVREILYELYVREGWKALGYTSYSAMVQGEFGRSRSYASRVLSAAEMEARNELPIGTFSEATLREVRSMLPEQSDQDAVLSQARFMGATGDDEVRRLTRRAYVQAHGHWITKRNMSRGDISINDAWEITGQVLKAGDGLAPYIASCTDSELAKMIVELPDSSNTKQEIIRTWCIPGDPQVALNQASASDLRHHLVIASREHRLAATVDRIIEYEQKIEELLELCEDVSEQYEIDSLKELTCQVRTLSRQRYRNGNTCQT